ncbi:MAG: UDP-N-acetylmuramoyl-L-alanyl-D-glutamate--2,6-diaminopimelate ligase, partial [Clostridia bacterium]|nr:UDP-N-acetylmuramoyl-L-alanyl-D-glutamate--2,6-diaminopimelate ligase [Clostridia bacterium]
MQLKDVLNGIALKGVHCDLQAEVTSVTIDSRKAAAGTLFCAVMGAETKVHGVKYAAGAVKNGAVCVLTDVACDESLPYVLVENTETALAIAAANLNGNPAKRLRVIGVTGTNGKTTTTHLVRDILAYNGKKCGLIGTNELVIGDTVVEDHPAFTTTPEPPELHALFAQMADAGCEFAIMEVSSHALALNRVYGVTFEAAAYTNLSQDHLNYHETMEAYAEAKSKLFAQTEKAVINLDDAYAAQMCAAATGKVTTFSRKSPRADLSANSVKLHAASVEFEALLGDDIQRMKLGI